MTLDKSKRAETQRPRASTHEKPDYPLSEIELRSRRSLTAIANAQRYDADNPKKQRIYSAQLWEMAREETAKFFTAVASSRELLQLKKETHPSSSLYDRPLKTVLASLMLVQNVLSSEMLFLLTTTGYEPPPPAFKLIADTSDLVIEAVTVASASENPGFIASAQTDDRVRKSIEAVRLLAQRLDGLQGESTKKVKREVSKQRRTLAVIGSVAIAFGGMFASHVVEEVAKDVVKTVVEHEIKQIPGFKTVDFGDSERVDIANST
jgi:hypothetical protein